MFEGCNYLNYNLIKQVQHSLDQANFYRGPGAVVEEEEPYHTPSIHELKQKFNTVPTRGQHGKSFHFIIPPYANIVNCAIVLVKSKEKG